MNGFHQMMNAAQPKPAVESISYQLIGVWRLVAYADVREGSEDSHPFGPEPVGFLIYTPDGFVSAQLMRPGRSAFQSRDWHHGTPEEFVESGSGYIGYCGTYEVDEANQTVSHIPTVALLPNLIRARQVRAVQLNGDRLALRTASAADADGVLVSSRLHWRRAGRPSESARVFNFRREG